MLGSGLRYKCLIAASDFRSEYVGPAGAGPDCLPLNAIRQKWELGTSTGVIHTNLSGASYLPLTVPGVYTDIAFYIELDTLMGSVA